MYLVDPTEDQVEFQSTNRLTLPAVKAGCVHLCRVAGNTV